MRALTHAMIGGLLGVAIGSPIASADDVYGWLIGGWELDVMVYDPQGGIHESKGEAHFSWVLDGRAVQDVWILPDVFYGTTLRVFDPALDAWHILWSDPLKQYYTRQLGRPRGDDIVQEGRTDNGMPVRWSFIEPSEQSFRWLGEYSLDGGTSWSVQADFQAHCTR